MSVSVAEALAPAKHTLWVLQLPGGGGGGGGRGGGGGGGRGAAGGRGGGGDGAAEPTTDACKVVPMRKPRGRARAVVLRLAWL